MNKKVCVGNLVRESPSSISKECMTRLDPSLLSSAVPATIPTSTITENEKDVQLNFRRDKLACDLCQKGIVSKELFVCKCSAREHVACTLFKERAPLVGSPPWYCASCRNGSQFKATITQLSHLIAVLELGKKIQ
jgi:hypothetical protein